MDLSNVVIVSDRLKLKAIDESFIEEIFKSFTADISTYMFPQPSGRIEDTEEFVKSSMNGLQEGSNLQLVIMDGKTEEFLGCCGLHNLKESEPELGIWLKKDAHNHGYGLEAIVAVIGWARSHVQFSHFKYPVDRNNYPSRRIPEFFNGKPLNEYKHMNMAGNELDIIEYWID